MVELQNMQPKPRENAPLHGRASTTIRKRENKKAPIVQVTGATHHRYKAVCLSLNLTCLIAGNDFWSCERCMPGNPVELTCTIMSSLTIDGDWS